MRALAVIPARFDSERLPGKPLLLLGSRPLVEWVYTAAASCPDFERVVVATDSERVAECVRGFGGEVALTGTHHRTGTDRVAEAAEHYPGMDVVANVQGDQPLVTAGMLGELLAPFAAGRSPEMTTLACPLEEGLSIDDPNVVKVVCDRDGRALYFSRAAIPHGGASVSGLVLHHLGLYAFRADFLRTYTTLPQTELERCEGLEQLRALEHGFAITVCRTARAVPEVNTLDDAERVRALIAR